MKLSDVMGHMDLAFWPQAALVIFLVVFFGVTARVYTRPKSAYQRFGDLPLEDDVTDGPSEGERHG